MNNTLITGGTGLVGSTINAKIKLTSQDVNLLDYNSTLEYFKKLSPEKIIHCAAKVGGLGGNMNHYAEYYYQNIMINSNVLHIAYILGVKKVVSFLSTCIFPDKVIYPITEDQIHNGEPHSSNFAYAYAKRMLEVQSRSYNKQYKTNFVCVIPTNIYGPNDNFNLANGHVVPALIHKCYLAMINKTNLTVWGSGKPLREFIYSEDVGKLSEWALKEYNDEEPIIFSTMEEVTIEELVEIIIKHMGFNGKVIWDNEKPDGQFKKPASNKKLLSYLPNYKFISLYEGIGLTIDWFKKNYPNIRK
ncbi:MAG: GDP-fucose synthetase [Candidatus Marinimicrobia bacterium]|nr:GDP-fucose synthetase [Candidatus Neomarinimicrobiota bacterium]|tara:strand:+ start:12427 stop:13332 length:906 start_codon:yes stop_codon:yes gene_type:complete